MRLSVRVTPKCSLDAIDGLYEAADGTAALKLRVRAQPEKGKANKAVAALIARTLGVAKSDVSIVTGAKDRTKTLLVHGDTTLLTERIDALIDAQN